MTQPFEKQSLMDYIYDFAFEYGKLFRTKLTPEETLNRISEKMPLPEEFADEVKKAIELEKQLAIQDYLLEHGSNDEKVNDEILILKGLKVRESKIEK